MNAILEQINSTGKIFVEFALPMLVQSSVLILILLLADFALRKKVRAVFRYWIWMLVLLKLLLPTSLSSPLSLGYFFGDELAYVDIAQITEEPQVTVVDPTPASVPPFIDLTNIETYRHTPTVPPIIPDTGPAVTEPINSPVVSVTPVTWQGVVFLLWLAVVMAMGLLLLQRANFVRGLVAQSKEANGVMKDTFVHCCESMRVKRKLSLKVSANVTSPAVCGLFRPVILVPQNLTSNLSANQLQAVLLHELAHIRRSDLWVNLAQTILQIIYFYNPLLWLANCVIRRVREQAVDEMVLVAMGEKARQYPQTLVNVAKMAFKRPALSLRLIGVVESKSALAGRIKHILNRPMPKRAKLGILGLAVVIVIAAILLPMATCTPGPPSLVIKGTVKDAQTDKPIAGARVFDDGYGPKPNWEQIRADVRSEWGAITNSAGEYSFLTWPEHHSIKVEAPGYKSERRSLYDGHFVFNKKDEEIFDFALEPEKILESSGFKKTLPNGVTVELVGICELPSKSKQWWRPDGSLVEVRPYLHLGYSMSSVSQKVLEAAFKTNMSDDEIGFTINERESGGLVHPLDDNPIEDIWAGCVRFDKDAERGSFLLGVATGRWAIISRSPAEGSSGQSSSEGDFTWGQFHQENESAVIPVTHNIRKQQQDYRVVAIDTSGNTHTSWGKFYGGSNDWTVTTSKFRNLTVEKIKEFQFQVRPYQWVEFKNVSLRSGVITDMRIEVEKSDVLRVPSDKYPTIQLAVNAAKDSDTIVVKSDVYEQNKVQIILQANVFTVNTPLSSITDFLKNEFDINKTTTELTDAQAEQFKEWVTSIPGTNIATSPRTIVFDGQSTEMSITTRTEYILYEKDADSPSGYKPKREEIKTGVEIEFRPELRQDNKLINLALNITKSDILQNKEITHESGNEVQLPAISRREISTMVAIPIGKYCLISIAGIRNMLQSEIDIQPDTTGKQTILLIKADVQVEEESLSDFQVSDESKKFGAVDFERYFVNSEAGGLTLDQLWDDKNKDLRDADEILEIIRKGLRRYSGSGNILRWIGNLFIWGKNPQNEKAIELMYHASGSSNRGLYGDAIYFGLSVTKNKTPEILQAMVAVAMKTDDYYNVTGRILWGCRNQKDELIACLDPHLNSDDISIRQKAQDVKNYFMDSKAFMAKRAKEHEESIQQEYGDKLGRFKDKLLKGDSQTRLDTLKQLSNKGIMSIVDVSFLDAFQACIKDSDPEVRTTAARIMGGKFIWSGKPQNTQAIEILAELLEDPDRSTRGAAVYYGLSTVRNPNKELVRKMLATILDDREINYYGRVIWGIRRNKQACVEILKEWMNQSEQDNQRAVKAYEIYEDVSAKQLPDEYAQRFAGQKSNAYEGLVAMCFYAKPVSKEKLQKQFLEHLANGSLMQKVIDFYIIENRETAVGMFTCDNLADRNAIRDALTKDKVFQVAGYMHGKIGPTGSGWVDSLQKFRKRNELNRISLPKPGVQVETEKPQSLIFHGLDLTAVPHTTNSSRLPDLFEERPLGSKSYHIQKDVTAIYSGLDGTVYFIPGRNIFYVQHDKLGSSTLTYYGPFEGNPVQVLNLQSDVQAEVERSDKSSESKSSRQAVEKLPEMRGRVYGVVVNSATGEPIAGAYVGVGDFGDSGGSNYSRHRQQGLYAKAQTDEEGRFVLEGIAFRDDHPLVVTHPEFVRHDMKVAVQRGGPEPEIKVSLRPAAKINVTVVDSNGKPLEGFWLIRLEALDGRYFIPPGQDRHLSSFASSVWMELPKPKMKPDKKSLSGTTGFSFTELDSGEYSIDVIKFTITDNYTPPPAGMVRLPLDTSNITYYGGIANLKIETGQTKEVAIKPANYQTSITIKMPDDPVKKPNIPPFVVISRNVGLLLWNDGKAHGPEDHRLGRLQKNALYYNMVVDGDVLTIKNLPPGSYSVFAGPIYFMNAVRMKVLSGREVTVEIPVIQLSEHAKVGLWTFDRKVKPEAGSYSVSDLCELISAKTGSNPRIIAEASIQNEKLKLSEREMSVWDLLETLYLEKGWKLKEGAKKTLVLYPAAKADVQVGVEKH